MSIESVHNHQCHMAVTNGIVSKDSMMLGLQGNYKLQYCLALLYLLSHVHVQ